MLSLPDLEFTEYQSRGYLTDINTNASGVYVICDSDGIILYIGKSHRLKERLTQHFYGKTHTAFFLDEIAYFSYAIITDKVTRELYETYYINKLKPKYNDKKAYYSKNSLIKKKPKFINKAMTKVHMKSLFEAFSNYPTVKAALYVLLISNEVNDIDITVDELVEQVGVCKSTAIESIKLLKEHDIITGTNSVYKANPEKLYKNPWCSMIELQDSYSILKKRTVTREQRSTIKRKPIKI